jgi:tRNA(fMet)-specific endonuclease VapC
MYLLDTDILNYFFRGHPRVISNFESVKHEAVNITIVSRIELLQGRMEFLLKASNASEILRAQFWLAQTEILLDQFRVIFFDEVALNIFEKLNQVSAYRKIGRADLLIASIALANKATLVTRNVKDFNKINQLKLENWID